MDLDQQKFEAARQLSEAHLALADARSSLAKLKEDEHLYLADLERRARDHVAGVLADCSGALDDVTRTLSDITAYVTDVRGIRDHLAELVERSGAFAATVAEIYETADAALAERQEAVNEARERLASERGRIAVEREALAKEQANIIEQTRLLKDRREAFERAWKELEAKKQSI